jgi:hypothetical protein
MKITPKQVLACKVEIIYALTLIRWEEVRYLKGKLQQSVGVIGEFNGKNYEAKGGSSENLYHHDFGLKHSNF